MTEHLVDLASYQHGINLAAVKAAGFSKVNIKLTEGTGYVDPYISEFVNGARANGLDICTFHWLDNSGSGAAQAQKALAQMDAYGLRYGTAHQVDCESSGKPATFAIWRDYVNAIQSALGRHVISYTGDWWWPAHMGSNSGAALTPYLWAAPNHGYDPGYPGDLSPDWSAGYGGWATYSALQYAVSPITGAGGGNLSKTAFRDPHVWTALTGVDAASTTIGEDVDFGVTDPNAWTQALRTEAIAHLKATTQTGEAVPLAVAIKDIQARVGTSVPVALTATDRAALVADLLAQLRPLIPTAVDIAKAVLDAEAARLAA